MKATPLAAALGAATVLGSLPVWATNGMNLEGYGPVALGMAGTSMAVNTGLAAMMNNPATLGMLAPGYNLALAMHQLGPDVKVNGLAESGGDSYLMPAFGFARRSGPWTYGLGMFAQGGMGTDYDRQVFGLDGLPERSELGVGRLLFPVAYQASPEFTVGGTVDLVWAMLDLRMAMPASVLGGIATGPLVGILPGDASYGRVDFSDSNDFTGKAKGYGYAGKLGFTYRPNHRVTIGGVYQSKTALSDIETSSNGASFTVDGTGGGTFSGKITVKDFQWPAIYGLGIAVQATPNVMVAADVKRIGWKDVMRGFDMNYTVGAGPLTGAYADFSLPQNWDDQTVLSVGAQYRVNERVTLRGGYSRSESPVPDATLNYLFPAIVEAHYGLGLDYRWDQANTLAVALSYAPEASQTAASGFTVSHSQFSWIIGYSRQF